MIKDSQYGKQISAEAIYHLPSPVKQRVMDELCKVFQLIFSIKKISHLILNLIQLKLYRQSFLKLLELFASNLEGLAIDNLM